MKREGLCWSELGFAARNKLKAKVIEQKISEVQKAQTEPQQTGVLVQKFKGEIYQLMFLHAPSWIVDIATWTEYSDWHMAYAEF